MSQILIADDDIELCQLLKEYLNQESFTVDSVYDGQSAIQQVKTKDYDLLILDVMMPVKNGFETLTEIRKYSQLPVIMLTAKGDKVDRILGLEMGADDYIPKPCDPRELVARIRAVIRRFQANLTSAPKINIIHLNNVFLDSNNREVTIQSDGDKPLLIDLTSTEFDILKLLLENSGQLVTREQISIHCLGKKLQNFDRSIDMHLSNVRKKLGDFSVNKPRIKTVRGSGYQYLVWPETND